MITRRLTLLAVICLAVLITANTSTAQIKLTEAGWCPNPDSPDPIVMSYPRLMAKGKKPTQAQTGVELTKNGAMVTYTEGGKAELMIADGGVLKVHITGMADRVRKVQHKVALPLSFGQGASYSFKGQTVKRFPATHTKGQNTYLYKGDARYVTMIDREGGKTTFVLPKVFFNQLTDSREWKFEAFTWFFNTHPRETIKLTVFTGDGKTTPLARDNGSNNRATGIPGKAYVNKFGQYNKVDFPTKIKDEADLKADVEREKKYYDSLPKWDELDEYGGWKGTKEKYNLEATGFFYTKKIDGKWWMVNPLGNLYINRGICAFMPLDDYSWVKNKSVFEWIPPYESEFKSAYHPQKKDLVFSFHLANQIRKYGKPYDRTEYTGRMVDRVKRMGFTSTGAFTDFHEAFRAHKYDPNHLILGSRLVTPSANNEQFMRIHGKYVDVVSINNYTYALDKDRYRQFNKWAGDKPFWLSEWNFVSPSDSGLPGGLRIVESEEMRGKASRNYVEQAVSLPFVVGYESYKLIGTSPTGWRWKRQVGVGSADGIFAISGRPYKPFIKHMTDANKALFAVHTGQQKPFTIDDPRFQMGKLTNKTTGIARMRSAEVVLDGNYTEWPKMPFERIGSDRLALGHDREDFEANFVMAWDDRYLYVMVNVIDPTPQRNDHVGKKYWSGDAMELFIGSDQMDQGGAKIYSDRQIILSASPKEGDFGWACGGIEPDERAQYPNMKFTVVPTVDGKGYSMEAQIPFRLLGFKPELNNLFMFDTGIDDSKNGRTRYRQLIWNGGQTNSSNRDKWGRAKLN